MRLRRLGFRTALFLVLVAVAPGDAQQAKKPKKPARGERYALLVGVRKYPKNELRDLSFTEADVVELAKVLETNGYKKENIVLMTQTAGAEEPRFLPLAKNIREELELLLQGLDQEDGVLVAMSGHGIQFKGDKDCYFCPADVRLVDKTTLISLKGVYDALQASGAGMKVLLSDACRNDPLSDNAKAAPVVKVESVSRPQAILPPGGVAAMFSCSTGQKSYENNALRHGVFFHFVSRGLKGEADFDKDGEVSVEELSLFTKRRVRDFVRREYGELQLPELKGETRDLLPLVNLSSGKPLVNSIGMSMALIPAEKFWMGSYEGDKEADDDEKPRHRVRITRPFYLGTTEVTVGQFRRFVASSGYKTEAETDGKGGWGVNQARDGWEQDPKYTWRNPGFDQTDAHPVTNVSWNDAVRFCEWLSEQEGERYRLPTEAEWEYACRAGSTTRYVFGDDGEGLAGVGNVADATFKARLSDLAKSRKKMIPDWSPIAASDGFAFTSPAGRFRANGFGLYDMHGNVWEWCSDGYDAGYYKNSPPDDPPGVDGAVVRVFRGGGWNVSARYARSASRFGYAPADRYDYLGFRAARVWSGE